MCRRLPGGRALIATGSLVGGLFAAFAFAVSAHSASEFRATRLRTERHYDQGQMRAAHGRVRRHSRLRSGRRQASTGRSLTGCATVGVEGV